MGKIRLVLFFIGLLLATFWAQASDTTLINALNKQAGEIIGKDVVKAENLAQKAYSLSVKHKYDFGKAEAASLLGKINMLTNEYDTAYKYFQVALPLFKKLKKEDGYAATLTGLGTYYLKERNYDKALLTQKEALNIVKGRNYTLQGDININIGNIYYYKANYDTTEYYYNKALTAYKTGNDTPKLFKCYRNLSLIAKKNREYDKATDLLFKALTIAEQNKQSLDVATTYNSIAILYMAIKEKQKAIVYYKKALQVLDKLPYKKLRAQINTNLVNVYVENDDHKLALKHAQIALKLFSELKDTASVALVHNNIGNIYNSSANYDSAVQHLTIAKKLAEQVGENSVVARAVNNLAHSYILKKQYKKANTLLLENLADIKSQNKSESLEPCLNNLYFTYYHLGNYHEALNYYLQLDSLQDSVYQKAKLATIHELEIKYETEKNKREIEQQATSIAMLQKDKKLYSIVAILLAVIALFVVLYIRSRSRQKILQQQIENKSLSDKVVARDKELLTTTLSMAHKNELIGEIKQRLDKIQQGGYSIGATVKEVSNLIEIDELHEKEWETFIKLFKDLHPDFIKNLINACPQLNQYDIRLCSLLRLNLTNQELKNILNISTTSLTSARYRLRKKLNIDSKTDLVVFLTQLG